MDRNEPDEAKTGYVKPKVTDYGDLQELTAAAISGSITDVPRGTPGPAVFS